MKVTMRILALAAALFSSGAAHAASYPDHPVKIVVPFAPAGPTDVMARLIAQKLSEALKQQFFVENHPGAGGNIGMAQVAKSAPDGYTILVASSSYVVNPSLYARILTIHSRISHRSPLQPHHRTFWSSMRIFRPSR